MSAIKIALTVAGVIFGLAAMGLLVSGTALTIAYGTQRDDDGFFNSQRYDLTSDGYALTSGDIDMAPRSGDWWPSDLASARFDIESDGGAPVFIGIGPADDVNEYLSGVALDQIVDLGVDNDDVEYEPTSGGAPSTTPGNQSFWVASSEGSGEQTVEWEVDQGSWMVVVMNADASAGVNVEARAGAKVDVLLPIGISLILAGLVAGVIAAFLLIITTRQLGQPVPAAVATASTAGTTEAQVDASAAVVISTTYPMTLEGRPDEPLSRWLWIIKWILAIPHYFILSFLWFGFGILTVVAFFAILINGKYPRGIFEFNVGVMRWSWRVSFYSLSALGTDKYPPFTMDDIDYPARLNVEYPEKLSRGLVLVKWWLLAIPHYMVVGILTNGLIWYGTYIGDGNRVLEIGGGLIGLLTLFAGIALLFTAKYPKDLFNLVMGLNRWVYRVAAYAMLMRDEYPPFRLDLGEKEPGGSS